MSSGRIGILCLVGAAVMAVELRAGDTRSPARPAGAAARASSSRAPDDPRESYASHEPLYAPGDAMLEESDPPQVDEAPQPASGEAVYEHEPLYAPMHPRFFERLHHSMKSRAAARRQPMARESWLNLPYSLGGFAGALGLADPIENHVDGHAGFVTGFRLGWDMSDRMGTEARFAFMRTGLTDPTGIVDLGDIKTFYCDVQWLYYPWGDTRLRPFLAMGVGFADLDFTDDRQRVVHELVFGMPFGGGLKYRLNPRLAMRAEVLDNVTFAGGDVDVMHSVSFTAGFEWHFGATSRRSYWPWNPSRTWW